MKSICLILLFVLGGLFFSSLATASLKEVRVFPGLANEQIWNKFVAESTKLGKVTSDGILSDFLAEGTVQFILDEKNELSGLLRQAINPEMLEEMKAGRYENYYQFFREFNGFGERVPLVTLKRLVSMVDGQEGIFAAIHYPLADDQVVETSSTEAVKDKIVVVSDPTSAQVKPVAKPEIGVMQSRFENLQNQQKTLQAEIARLIKVNAGNAESVAQINDVKKSLTTLISNMERLSDGQDSLIKNQDTFTSALTVLEGAFAKVNVEIGSLRAMEVRLRAETDEKVAGVDSRVAQLARAVDYNQNVIVLSFSVVATFMLVMIIFLWLRSRGQKEIETEQGKINKKINDLECQINGVDFNHAAVSRQKVIALKHREAISVTVTNSNQKHFVVTITRSDDMFVMVSGLKRQSSDPTVHHKFSVTTDFSALISKAGKEGRLTQELMVMEVA